MTVDTCSYLIYFICKDCWGVECCVYEMQVKLLIAHHEPIDIISFASLKSRTCDIRWRFVRPLLSFVRNFRLLFQYHLFINLLHFFCFIAFFILCHFYRRIVDNNSFFNNNNYDFIAMRKASICWYVGHGYPCLDFTEESNLTISAIPDVVIFQIQPMTAVQNEQSCCDLPVRVITETKCLSLKYFQPSFIDDKNLFQFENNFSGNQTRLYYKVC